MLLMRSWQTLRESCGSLAVVLGLLVAITSAHAQNTFDVKVETGGIVSLRRVNDGFPTDYIQTNRRLGDVSLRYRGKDGAWGVTFWNGEVQIDSKAYSEKEYAWLRGLLRAANAWIFSAPVQIGDCWSETINQGPRDVEVVAVKKLRYRIEYEMPNAGMMGSWQTGILIGGKLYA